VVDFNEAARNKVVRLLDDPRVDLRRIDVNKPDETIGLMQQYDFVVNGTPAP